MKRYNFEHDCPFEAFVANTQKRKDGVVVGEWIKLPTTTEDLEAAFKRIGIGSTDEFGQPYNEWSIIDRDVYVDGLYPYVELENNIFKLNDLALKIESLKDQAYNELIISLCNNDFKTIEEIICSISKHIVN